MKKQYRAELCALARAGRVLRHRHRQTEVACRRQVKALKRDLEKGRRSTRREMAILNRRAAILKARINS
jgi:hypothetical protein